MMSIKQNILEINMDKQVESVEKFNNAEKLLE